LDATQTSDPTGVGPGTPGQASAFRRALDDQALHAEAAKEGPLDLTVPLDVAEIRAALSSSGSNKKPPPPEDLPPPLPGAVRRGRRRGGEHAAPPGHAGSKRLGRIGVFVALATALSVGTAAALVLSSGGQGASVSLPTTNGNLPVVATAVAGGPGQVPQSSSAASPSPSLSASPSASAAAPSPSASAGSPSPVSSPSAAPTQSQDPGTPSASPFPTLQQGSSGATVTEVQQMLAELYLLIQQRQHRDGTVFTYVRNRTLSDPSGSYGDATATAVAAFQQADGVGAEPGVVDQATFDALTAATSGQ
jgi:Putative peptidoglycan binding domain